MQGCCERGRDAGSALLPIYREGEEQHPGRRAGGRWLSFLSQGCQGSNSHWGGWQGEGCRMGEGGAKGRWEMTGLYSVYREMVWSKQGSAPDDLTSTASQTPLPGGRSGDGTSGRREVLGQDNAIHSWIMNLDFRVECAWGMCNLLVTGIVPIEENGKSFM